MKDVLAEIKLVQSDTRYSKETEKNYDHWLVNQAVEDIERFKSHIVRGVWNDQAKQEILKTLGPNEVFITIDWAMYVPILILYGYLYLGIFLLRPKSEQMHQCRSPFFELL